MEIKIPSRTKANRVLLKKANFAIPTIDLDLKLE